jgi:hypothetical protein
MALLLLTTLTAVAAMDVTLSDKETQKCSGMYSKKSWGGKVDPFILVKFIKDPKKNEGIKDQTVSVVVWEWKDTLLLGAPSDLPVNDVCGPWML